ncbi:MAG: GNAT family N-acetyltransferase [Planctomycetota bacterium]|nr:GNAT family N-acetyltransferase [Planctomycetota bacterium]
MQTSFRPATPADLAFILENIKGLAAVEGRPDVVTVSTQRLGALLFGSTPVAQCSIVHAAGIGDVGHAWYYYFAPTFTGTLVLYLEDLYIRPEYRGLGIGRDCMAHLAALAKAAGAEGMAWSVVDGNDAAVSFYEQLGAHPKIGSTTYRLDGDEFERLSHAAAPPRIRPIG